MIYQVNVTQEGNSWLAEVPGLAGAHTYADTHAGALEGIREAIILSDDLDDNADFTVVEHSPKV